MAALDHAPLGGGQRFSAPGEGARTAGPSRWEGRVFSDGWRPGGGGTTEVREPATGDVLAAVGIADAADVARAVSSAADAQRRWAATPRAERIEILERAADALVRDHEGLFEWLVRETGSARVKARGEIEGAAKELRHAVSVLAQTDHVPLPAGRSTVESVAERVPVGVVGAITPWNAPVILAMRVLAPALALGNAVVLKPDLQSSISGGLAIAALFEAAGLPVGLLHVLPGGPAVGEALVRAPQTSLLSFTGSVRAGRAVSSAAGLTRTSLELGGNNPIVVMDDADIEAAAASGAWGSFFHQGQICTATGRHLVHERVLSAYAEALRERALALRVGDPWREPDVELGPIINERQLAHVHACVTGSVAQGARLIAGGTHDGLFYRPTVLDGVAPEMPAFTEEIFGPVGAITAFSSTDEAIALANGTDCRLAAAVHTSDLDGGQELLRSLDFGMVHLNDTTVKDAAHAPFGGMGAAGNGARYGGPATWEEFTVWRWRSIRRRAPQRPW